MAPPSLLLVPTLCFLLVPFAQSAHLLMAPLALHSHTAAFQAIAEELVRRGHQVTFMYNEASKHGTKLAASGFRVLTFECKGDICEKFDSLSTELAQVALEEPGDVIAFYRNIINNIAPGECDRMLGDDVFQQKIADSKFDFALMDGIFFYRCAYMIPHRHHIPYATVEDVVDARTCHGLLLI